MFEKINVSKQDNTLKLGFKRAKYVDTTTKAVITIPHLRSLHLSGAAQGTFSNYNSRSSVDFTISGASSLDLESISVGDANFDVSGASKVAGEITAGDVEFNIDGASTIELEGFANNIVCEAEGSSQLELDNLTVNNADVRLSDASTSTVSLDGKLDVDLSGASKLRYSGEPVLGETKISGGSTLSRE